MGPPKSVEAQAPERERTTGSFGTVSLFLQAAPEGCLGRELGMKALYNTTGEKVVHKSNKGRK